MAAVLAQKWGIPVSCFDSCVEKADLKKWILDQDIRKLEISSILIPQNIQRIPSAQNIEIEGPIFAQVAKITDLTKPTRKSAEGEELIQTGPKGLLMLSLTDGLNKFDVVDIYDTAGLTVKTAPPGSKVLLLGRFRVFNGILFPLNSGKLEILGGKVEKLFEAWKANLAVNEKRTTLDLGPGPKKFQDSETPPRFVSFSDRPKNQPMPRQAPQLSPPPTAPVTAKKLPRFESGDDQKSGLFANHKLSSDTFGHSEKKGGPRRPRTSRFEAKDTEREFLPPSRSSAGLAAFIKVDKSEAAETAQFLRDIATVEEQEEVNHPRQEHRQFRGRGGRRGRGRY